MATDPRGAVVVDERRRTTRRGIYAAGDITRRDQFVYMAAYGAKLAALNALEGDVHLYSDEAMPWVVFTDPQVAEILAPEGAEAIQTMAIAIKVGMTTKALGQTIFPHLTTVEASSGVCDLAGNVWERVADDFDGVLHLLLIVHHRAVEEEAAQEVARRRRKPPPEDHSAEETVRFERLRAVAAGHGHGALAGHDRRPDGAAACCAGAGRAVLQRCCQGSPVRAPRPRRTSRSVTRSAVPPAVHRPSSPDFRAPLWAALQDRAGVQASERCLPDSRR